jgi:uncharacterized protein
MSDRSREREVVMHTMMRALALTALVAAVAIAHVRPAAAAEGDKTMLDRTISVSASGTVAAEPDLAQISTGVVSEGDTAKDAIARNSATMAKVVDGLKAAGIPARDIQTATLNVEPRYTQAKDGRPPVINGYRVVNQVRITVRDVKKLGDLLDQVIALGANQVSGITFEVSNAETLKDEARKQAMANAKRRAELFATAAGVQLGGVLQISETAGEVARPMFAARGLAAAPVPIEAGTRVLGVEVTVVYALK